MSTSTSVEKALQILTCFTTQDIDMSLAELHDRIKISKPSLHRLCNTLCDNGFLTKNPVTGRYRLGIKMLETAGIYIAGNNAYHSVWQVLNSIMEISGETISLYIREDDFRKCLMRIECNSPLRHTVTIGQTLPLDKGAAGKTILAHSDDGHCDIKDVGYAITYGEREAYLGAIAVPVFDENNQLFGALSISGPIDRIREKVSDELIEQLKSHAKSLTNLVNHL